MVPIAASAELKARLLCSDITSFILRVPLCRTSQPLSQRTQTTHAEWRQLALRIRNSYPTLQGPDHPPPLTICQASASTPRAPADPPPAAAEENAVAVAEGNGSKDLSCSLISGA